MTGFRKPSFSKPIVLNGTTQQQFLVPSPTFFPTIPSISDLSAAMQ